MSVLSVALGFDSFWNTAATVAAILVGVAVVIAAFLWALVTISEWWEIRHLDDEFDYEKDVRRAQLALPDHSVFLFIEQETVWELINTNLDPTARNTQIENSLSGEVGSDKVAKVRTGSSSVETFEPDADATLTSQSRKLLEFLHDNGRISWHLNVVTIQSDHGFTSLESNPEEFLTKLIGDDFPEGLGEVTTEQFVGKVMDRVGQGHQASAEEVGAALREKLEQARDLGQNQIVILQNEWEVLEEGDEIILSKTGVNVAMTGPGHGYAHAGNVDGYTGSGTRHPMPDGLSIVARVRADELRRAGKRRLEKQTTPVRLSIVGNIKDFRATDGCFEVTPLLIYTGV